MNMHNRNFERSVDLSARETSDNYRAELFRMGLYRVVVCRHGLQWVFQKQRFKKNRVGGRLAQYWLLHHQNGPDPASTRP